MKTERSGQLHQFSQFYKILFFRFGEALSSLGIKKKSLWRKKCKTDSRKSCFKKRCFCCSMRNVGSIIWCLVFGGVWLNFLNILTICQPFCPCEFPYFIQWKHLFSLPLSSFHLRCNTESEWYQIHENIIKKANSRYNLSGSNTGKNRIIFIFNSFCFVTSRFETWNKLPP